MSSGSADTPPDLSRVEALIVERKALVAEVVGAIRECLRPRDERIGRLVFMVKEHVIDAVRSLRTEGHANPYWPWSCMGQGSRADFLTFLDLMGDVPTPDDDGETDPYSRWVRFIELCVTGMPSGVPIPPTTPDPAFPTEDTNHEDARREPAGRPENGNREPGEGRGGEAEQPGRAPERPAPGLAGDIRGDGEGGGDHHRGGWDSRPGPLTLVIGGTVYAVHIDDCGIELTKPDGSTIIIIDGPDGPECSCLSAKYRPGLCKHRSALIDAGLLPPPMVFPEPDPAPHLSPEEPPMTERCPNCKDAIDCQNGRRTCDRCGKAGCNSCVRDVLCWDCQEDAHDPPMSAPDAAFHDALMAFGLPSISGGAPEDPSMAMAQAYRDASQAVAAPRVAGDRGRDPYTAEDFGEPGREARRLAALAIHHKQRSLGLDDDPPPISGGSPEAEPPDTLLDDLEQLSGSIAYAHTDAALAMKEAREEIIKDREEIRRLRAEVATLGNACRGVHAYAVAQAKVGRALPGELVAALFKAINQA